MWLASLLRIGVLKASFIPEKHIRQLRELVTLRKSYIKTLADYKRRVHKLFETANIKISSVVSNLFGNTGRNLMNKLIDTDIEITIGHVEECAEGSLKQKAPELFRSIQGFFETHHRFQLKMMMQTINHLESEIEAITRRLDDIMLPHQEMIDQLDQVPGIDKKTAQSITGLVAVHILFGTLNKAPGCLCSAVIRPGRTGYIRVVFIRGRNLIRISAFIPF